MIYIYIYIYIYIIYIYIYIYIYIHLFENVPNVFVCLIHFSFSLLFFLSFMNSYFLIFLIILNARFQVDLH